MTHGSWTAAGRRGLRLGIVAVAALVLATPMTADSATAPPSGRIVFTSGFGASCDGKGGQICTVDVHGHGLAAIAAPAGAQDPSFSRNRKLIAFTVVGSGTAELMVMNADGSHAHAIVDQWAEIDRPTWSPDGKSIAFAGEQSSGGNIVLCVVHADGAGLRILGDPTDVPFASEPAWSPNGAWIAFDSVPDSMQKASSTNPSGIYLVHPDGTGWHRLTPVTTSLDQTATWSPDGTWIAYTKLAPNWETTHISSIYRMKANGTGSRRLTTGFWDGNPVISPNGEQIAFYRYRGTNVDPHMYVINATGGPAHRVLGSEATPHAWISG